MWLTARVVAATQTRKGGVYQKSHCQAGGDKLTDEQKRAKAQEDLLKLLREEKKSTEAKRQEASLGLAGVALAQGGSRGEFSERVDKLTGVGKPWKNLDGAEKVARATVGTSRFFLIGFGALLTLAIGYTVTSELFARNSPTVIYEEACKLLLRNKKIHEYLLEPYIFQTNVAQYIGDYSPLNPPSHPSRPSQTVHSSRTFDPRTGDDTLYLHFYIESRDKDTPLSYWQTFRLGVIAGTHWAKDRVLDGYDTVKIWWDDLDKEPAELPAKPFKPEKPTQPWWITKKLRGAVHSVGELVGSSKDALGMASVDFSTGLRTVPGTFTEGEVHIELLKDGKGVYQYKRFYVDVPNSSSPLRRRVYLDSTHDELPIRN
ncbi:hypothetical protein MVES_001986 [Malassezia vespertilionis]|uniref:Mitochondrial import inner membrane translocase subunit Tim21 n=1 Tax=Malassezia vespertilionis TaxID=2020962 RepID=A0A2N1JBH9_9BASI|nr:hypothetical protein MVES_001986 [Malassezia vespertilionis]